MQVDLLQRKDTFFVKLLIRFFTITMIVILIFGFSVIYYFKGFYFSQKEDEIIKNSSAVMEYLAQSFVKNDRQEIVNWLNILAKLNSGQVWLINNQGYLIFSYPYLFSEEKRFSRYETIFTGKIISRLVDASDFEDPMLLVGLPVNYNEEVEAALLIFTPIKAINSTIYQVEKLMVLISILSIFLILIISYVWSKSLATPLQNIGNIAFEISKGEFGKTMTLAKEGVSSEIDTLLDSINSMSTKLKRTIDNLIEERNKLKHVLTGMEEGIIAVNKFGEIILINESACKLLDLNRNLMGKEFAKVIRNKKVLTVFETALKKFEENWQEVLIKRGNSKQCILIHCTPIYTDNREFWGGVALFQDISERYRFEKLQREFVANISHELKAPLTSIQGAVELLLDGVANNKIKQNNYLKMILLESNRLTDLINETLILAEIDAGGLKLHKEIINVKNLFENMRMFFNNIKKEGQEMKLIIPDEKIGIYANQEKIKQVLINLISNSVKFSPGNGMIELGTKLCDDKIKIWVKDQGIGIPDSELNNIWERFYKIDKARTPGTNSSGLGLAIVKQIIEEHQGRVFVQSELKRGSTIGFFLPIK
ncbi:ATP-binding protein [Halocella sp. SP3-1]|uniref:ATP-binding protein n=1 Tax=Halocella sp. SP3-1 TaxID=2382161 RepID=UPI000F75D736|nr:ATP-binding protein [Halocella sp. SP3-1]AZO94154.1 PAS domain-containing protein [Halocella sp. SP3-1]